MMAIKFYSNINTYNFPFTILVVSIEYLALLTLQVLVIVTSGLLFWYMLNITKFANGPVPLLMVTFTDSSLVEFTWETLPWSE